MALPNLGNLGKDKNQINKEKQEAYIKASEALTSVLAEYRLNTLEAEIILTQLAQRLAHEAKINTQVFMKEKNDI